MSLRSLRLPEAVVELPGGKFSVRGLSLNDITVLVQRHGAGLQALFQQLVSANGDLSTDSVAAFAGPLVRSAPNIAADIIACGSGDPEDAEIAAMLPFPVQIDALEKIARLTFDAGGGPKKLVETVIRLAQGMTGLIENLKT